MTSAFHTMLSAALILLCVDVQQEQPHINAYASSLIFLTKAEINLIHQETLLVYEGKIHSSSWVRGDEIGHNVPWQIFTVWSLTLYRVTVVYNYSNCWTNWGQDLCLIKRINSECVGLPTCMVSSQAVIGTRVRKNFQGGKDQYRLVDISLYHCWRKAWFSSRL